MALESNNQSCGCAEKLVGPCRGFFRYFTLGHPVHPIQPTAPGHSEFLNLGSKIRVRVIHVKPHDDSIQNEHYPCFNFNSKRLSLSEEYWFTRWNKPLKTGICNCSFRRSLRYSAIVDVTRNSNRLSNFDTPATRIINVDTFVERLVQETIFEALQEYVISKVNPKIVAHGVSNASYENSKDDTDGILLRSIKEKCDNAAAILPTDCETVEISRNFDQKNSICEHKISANKNTVSKLLAVGFKFVFGCCLTTNNIILFNGYFRNH